MTISLIRHGRPAVDYRTRIAAATFGAWLEAYESASIDASLPPPTELRHALGDCRLLITSPARRARESADALRLPVPRIELPDAAEAALGRDFIWPVKLKPLTLTVIARTLWTLGLSRAAESRTAAVRRSHDFAATLNDRAREFGHIAVVGHGYFHRFTADVLRASGWSVARSGHGYWSCTRLQRAESETAVSHAPAESAPI